MPKNDEKGYMVLQAELDELMLKLQSAELDADTAVELYSKGLGLVELLEARLVSAKNTVKQLKADFEKR